jgi:hypothetical protein
MKKLLILIILGTTLLSCIEKNNDFKINLSFNEEASNDPLDGRLLLLLSTDDSSEPRFQINDNLTTQIVFGQNVEDMQTGQKVTFDQSQLGFPIARHSAWYLLDSRSTTHL